MHQKTIDALAAYGNEAGRLLEAISGFGKELAWQAKEPVDPTAEHIELRMKTADFRGLLEMFAEVDEFVAGCVSVDAEEADAAIAAANA